jgi:hypothetical protein
MYTVEELLLQTRNTLTDYGKDRWSDTDLLEYYNEGIKILGYDRDGKTSKSTFVLDPLENSYIFTGILKYVSAIDDLGNIRKLYLVDDPSDVKGILIRNYNELYISDPTVGTLITLTYTTMEDEQNMNDAVRVGDESALKSFILMMAYEKETDEESAIRASKYERKFIESKNKLMGKGALPMVVEAIATTVSYQY